MNNITMPKSRQQKEFEQMAQELVKVLADLQEDQQITLFEYAIQLYKERHNRIFTDWRK